MFFVSSSSSSGVDDDAGTENVFIVPALALTAMVEACEADVYSASLSEMGAVGAIFSSKSVCLPSSRWGLLRARDTVRGTALRTDSTWSSLSAAGLDLASVLLLA